MDTKNHTSWENISPWYQSIVGEKGHYYHQHVILPNLIQLLNFDPLKKIKILDLACGQGVFSRQLAKEIEYVGIDISSSLIKLAKEQNNNSKHRYLVGDACKKLPIRDTDFTHGVVILALQNIEEPHLVFQNMHKHLIPQGSCIFVLNHPCFRIPRQSSWGIDDSKKLQFRRIDRYMSSCKIPIQTHPSKGEKSRQTWSFHHPLSSYFKWLQESGFVIESLEEWCSDKTSVGSAAKMENRARKEFPIFLVIKAIKTDQRLREIRE